MIRIGLVRIGVRVLVLEDVALIPHSPLKRGELGILVERAPAHLYIRWDTPHWDWPGRWRNELYLTEEDGEVITKLKFNPHASVIDFYRQLSQVA